MNIRRLMSPRPWALLLSTLTVLGCEGVSTTSAPPGRATDVARAQPNRPTGESAAEPGAFGEASADAADGGAESPAPPAASRGWRPFSDDSPWNTPIPEEAPMRPDSDALMADLATSSEWPGLLVSITPWSIPVYDVDASTPLVDVHAAISNEGEGVTFRWPVPEGAMPAPAGDAHLTLLDRAGGRGYDFWQARRHPDGSFECGVCATVDLEGTGVLPPKGGSRPWYESHGSRACGYPLIAGLITVEEIEAGRIDHALVIAYPALRQRWFTSPASTGHPANGLISEHTGIPCGGRIQLDPSIDVDSLDLTPAARTIARALQEYGAFVGDYSGSINLYAEGSPEAQAAWQGVLTSDVLTSLDLARDFRVIEWGELTPDG